MALVEPRNDIAALWEEALTDYEKITNIDMRSCLRAQQSVNSIMMDQQRQLENFIVFRHDKGKLDRFRTLISSNADIIQGVVKHVTLAASAAFPPSCAILTAFTFVMTASKSVSDDYDMIEGFFSIMHSFLKRLSLLEGNIPPERNFQTFLVNVFSSLLELSAIARAYCGAKGKGRLSKWAKALVDGKDPHLTAAYDKLNGNLQDLESAIIIQTLRNTIEISEGVKMIQGQLGGIGAISMQTLETSQQTFAVTVRTETGVQQLLHSSLTSATTSNEMLRLQNSIAKKLDKMQAKDNKEKQRNMKSGASKPVNFDRLRMDYLKNEAEGGVNERLADLELSCVEGLFDWIQADPAFENIINEEENFLCVSATSGMGKSTLSFRIYQYLEKRYSLESTTSVAWFPFDEEHPEMRSVSNMLQCCSIRAAKKDPRYCTETLAVLQRGESGEVLETVEDAWTHLIGSRYTKESDRRLILVLDGIDQTNEDDFLRLIKLMSRIRSQECSIQVIFTCDPDKKQDLFILDAKCIDLTRDKIIRDMRRFVWSRTKTLSRLRKLRVNVRKTIRKRVIQKADSFLYIDHTMRRLNAIGREGPIMKELDNLSDNTTALYRALFEECQRNRTSEDRELLRNLLAWLAYMKTKFTVAEANLLIKIINKEHSISIEEELDGRLSRLLRISGDRAEIEQDESSESEDKQGNISEEHEELEKRAEDANNFLSFQERSLKAYFRNAIQDHPDELRCTATEAQAIIFRTCAAILTMPKKSQKPAELKLLEYASAWGLSHLLQIKPDEEGSVSDDLAKAIIESIYNVFTNKNDSLKPLEQREMRNKTILGRDGISQEEMLAALSAWAKRARRLPPNQLPYGILDWFRPLAQQPLRIFIGLSRAHITNWFSSNNRFDAYAAFISAHAALQEGKTLPELKQNPNLKAYFEHFMEGDKEITERSFEVVAGSFWDIMKTSSSYKGIGMAMKALGLYEPAVKQLNKGLEDGTIEKLEQFVLLTSKGHALLMLGSMESDKEEKREQYLKESLSILTHGNDLYREMNQTGQIDDELRALASFNFENTAHVAALLNKSDLVLSISRERLETKARFFPDTLSDVIDALQKDGQFLTIVELLKLLPKTDITWYLVTSNAEPTEEAMMRAGEGQYLLDLYDAAQKTVGTWSFETGEFRARLESSAATFARQALGNLDVAKTLLRGMIDNPRTPSWYVHHGCNQLAEILFEDFRLSKNPSVKKSALEETLRLLEKPAEVLPNSYNAAESQLIITIALMLRRLGPALDFSTRLDAAFRNCTGELRDDTGVNDANALRRLARVLSCVPGFEEAASISLTAQLYIVDEDVRRKELQKLRDSQENEAQALSEEKNEIVNGDGVQDGHGVEHDSPVTVQSIDAIVHGDVNHSAPTQDSVDGITESVINVNENSKTPAEGITTPVTVVHEMDEGLFEKSWFYCNFCGEVFKNWHTHGAAYLCVYCIDMDICEKCYLEKIAREKGELEPDWRVICPKGHRHVKAPTEGWRGIKGGRMRIGAEEVPFKTWLAQLEVKWAKYWEDFWTEAETV